MEELAFLLNNISDSYVDFVTAIIHYAGKDTNNLEDIIAFIKNNPNVTSSDVVKYVSDRKDFKESAVCTPA